MATSSFSQIVITTEKLPMQLGTTLVSLYDTTAHAIVDVGLPGPNQTWNFTQDIKGIEIATEVVELDSTPFAANFPNANWVIKYGAGLLDLIYSEIFPQIKGDIFFYQQITENEALILGTGFISNSLTGSANFQPPNVILQLLPTQYLNTWSTKSAFSISMDTTIAGSVHRLTLTVNDSAFSFIDGWGKVILPLGTFDCLRMKSYVFMDERVYLDGIPIRTYVSRIINYNWLADDVGLLVRIASHTNESNDQFTDARLFTRLERIGALPVQLSAFVAKVQKNDVLLNWQTETETNNLGFTIERRSHRGEYQKIGFVHGSGSSVQQRFYSFTDTALRPGKYFYRLKQIDLNGTFDYSNEIQAIVQTPKKFALLNNFPNPFNPETTIYYDVPNTGTVYISIFNHLGQFVTLIENSQKVPGTYGILWNGKNTSGDNVASGIYFCRVIFTPLSNENSNPSVQFRKMLLLR